MANYIYIATSLDGFIARKDGSFDWLLDLPNPDGSDFGFADFMKNIDAVVMGRNTFEIVLKFDEWYYNKPVFVLSSSLKSIPDKFSDKAQLLNAKPDEAIKQLNSRGFNNLYIDGGKTIQDFLRMELIDEMIITRIPILIGEGIPLFGSLQVDQKFEHIKTEILLHQSVKSYYKKSGNQLAV